MSAESVGGEVELRPEQLFQSEAKRRVIDLYLRPYGPVSENR